MLLTSTLSRTLSVGFVAIASAAFATAQCPATESNHLCCLSFGHFSDNYQVWTEDCGLDFPNSTTIGSACEQLAAPCFEGLIALCCESTAMCEISVDGILGVNCTEVED